MTLKGSRPTGQEPLILGFFFSSDEDINSKEKGREEGGIVMEFICMVDLVMSSLVDQEKEKVAEIS